MRYEVIHDSQIADPAWGGWEPHLQLVHEQGNQDQKLRFCYSNANAARVVERTHLVIPEDRVAHLLAQAVRQQVISPQRAIQIIAEVAGALQ